MKVKILEKDQPWTDSEISHLTILLGVEIQGISKRPNRIAIMSKPVKGSIEDALQGTDYIMREVDFAERWD